MWMHFLGLTYLHWCRHGCRFFDNNNNNDNHFSCTTTTSANSKEKVLGTVVGGERMSKWESNEKTRKKDSKKRKSNDRLRKQAGKNQKRTSLHLNERRGEENTKLFSRENYFFAAQQLKQSRKKKKKRRGWGNGWPVIINFTNTHSKMFFHYSYQAPNRTKHTF